MVTIKFKGAAQRGQAPLFFTEELGEFERGLTPFDLFVGLH